MSDRHLALMLGLACVLLSVLSCSTFRAPEDRANTAPTSPPHQPHCLAAAPNRDAHSDPDPHADVDSRAQPDRTPSPALVGSPTRAPH